MCTRGSLDWIVGETSSRKGLSSIGTGCPGKQLSYHSWGYLKDLQMRHLERWFSGELDSVGLMVAVHYFRGIFQPK